jgi:beta-glucosidase
VKPTGGLFPGDFLWGAATAGHQVEGGNVNADLWPLEWAENSFFQEPSGDACDHYHRYAEDLAILAEYGCNAYRFSLEWARIEPESGFFSYAALDHYARMVERCLELDLTPIVTLNHFTLPRWMADRGRWSARDAPERFANYAARVAAHMGDLLSWVATLNEPNAMSLLASTGSFAMGTSDESISLSDLTHEEADQTPRHIGPLPNELEVKEEAHRLAGSALRAAIKDIKVGWTLALPDFQCLPGGEERFELASRVAQSDWLEVSRDDEFVGVQTYTRNLIGPEGVVPPPDGTAVMQTGWEVYPEALEHTVRLAAAIAQVPVLVTENGMATDDDEARIAYTRGALQGLSRCLTDGIDVRGYLHWTLLDNFEWTAGYSKTFGLVAVDRQSFARTVKPSARWLGEVAARNSL